MRQDAWDVWVPVGVGTPSTEQAVDKGKQVGAGRGDVSVCACVCV